MPILAENYRIRVFVPEHQSFAPGRGMYVQRKNNGRIYDNAPEALRPQAADKIGFS